MFSINAIEYEVRDDVVDIQDGISIFFEVFFSERSFGNIVVLESVFLRNKREYKFNQSEKILRLRSLQDAEKLIESLKKSCFDKGHLSVLFAFKDPAQSEKFIKQEFYEKRNEINLYREDSAGPLSDDQRKTFCQVTKELYEETFELIYAFSHDAEYLYEINSVTE